MERTGLPVLHELHFESPFEVQSVSIADAVKVRIELMTADIQVAKFAFSEAPVTTDSITAGPGARRSLRTGRIVEIDTLRLGEDPRVYITTSAAAIVEVEVYRSFLG